MQTQTQTLRATFKVAKVTEAPSAKAAKAPAPKREYSRNPKAVVSRLRNQFAAEWEIVGGLSAPSKMPGTGISIPAKYCRVGGNLSNVPGSTCFKCYAKRGRYVFASVQAAMQRRYECLLRAAETPEGREAWVNAMACLIREGGL